MKTCKRYGTEIDDKTVFCPKCGYANGRTQFTDNTSHNRLRIAAKVFMILGCIVNSFILLPLATLAATTVGTILIMCIPLIWCIPITVDYWKNCDIVGVTFKISTLLFVSQIAGILMLCDKTY